MLNKLVRKEWKFAVKFSILFVLILLGNLGEYSLKNSTYSILPKLEVINDDTSVLENSHSEIVPLKKDAETSESGDSEKNKKK